MSQPLKSTPNTPAPVTGSPQQGCQPPAGGQFKNLSRSQLAFEWLKHIQVLKWCLKSRQKVCILDSKTAEFSYNMFKLWMEPKILTKSQDFGQWGYLDTKPLLVWFLMHPIDRIPYSSYLKKCENINQPNALYFSIQGNFQWIEKT